MNDWKVKLTLKIFKNQINTDQINEGWKSIFTLNINIGVKLHQMLCGFFFFIMWPKILDGGKNVQIRDDAFTKSFWRQNFARQMLIPFNDWFDLYKK